MPEERFEEDEGQFEGQEDRVDRVERVDREDRTPRYIDPGALRAARNEVGAVAESMVTAREQASRITPPVRTGSEEDDKSGLESFFAGLDKATIPTVRVSVKWRPLWSSEKYCFKDSDVIETDQFVLDEVLKRFGTRFGKGDYQFQFTVPRKDGSTLFTRTFNVPIDLESVVDNKPVAVNVAPQQPIPQTNVELLKIAETMKQGFEVFGQKFSEMKEAMFQKEREDQKRMLEDQNRQIVELRKEMQSAKNAPVAQPIPQVDVAGISERILNSAMKVMTTMREMAPTPQILPQIQPQQAPMELVRSLGEAFTAGLNVGKEVIAASGIGSGGAGSEEGEGSGGGGLMDTITNFGGKILERAFSGIAGGATAQQMQPALPGSQPAQVGNPANDYVAYVLNNLTGMIAQGYAPAQCAQFMRDNLTPSQATQLVSVPVVNIVQSIPQLAQYQAQLSAVLAALAAQMRPAPAQRPAQRSVQRPARSVQQPQSVQSARPAQPAPKVEFKSRRNIGEEVEESGEPGESGESSEPGEQGDVDVIGEQ